MHQHHFSLFPSPRSRQSNSLPMAPAFGSNGSPRKDSNPFIKVHNGVHSTAPPNTRRAQTDYGDPISRMQSETDFKHHEEHSSDASYPSLRAQDSSTRLTKIEIRRRLKQKHHNRIPGHLKWTRWMHTESKNRNYSREKLGILLTMYQIRWQ